jgi:hypothetical protein
MALSVLCGMEQQTQYIGWQLGSTDKSGVGERRFRSCGELPKGTLDSRAPAGHELTDRWVRSYHRSFAGKSGTL